MNTNKTPRRPPMKRFACAELHPGCDRVFTGPGDQAVLDQVLAHAAADHHTRRPGMAFIEQIVVATRPISTTAAHSSVPHLRLVGARPSAPPDADHRAGGKRDGRSSLPVGTDGAGQDTHPPATVTTLADRPARAHRSYRHECWFYHGDTEFLAVVLPFITDGLARHQPVMIALPPPRLQAVRDALGDDADKVVFADMADLGDNPARIIPAWQDFTEKHRGDRQPLRGIGQPIWAGRSPAEVVEAQFHEALLNLAVSPDTPLWLLCPYDTAALPDPVIDEAMRSHPVLAESGGYRGSTRYGGAYHADSLFGSPLPDPATPTTEIVLDPAGHRHVAQIIRYAAAAGIASDRAENLAAATTEIARGHRDTDHAGGVRIRLWHDHSTVLCEITDPGTVADPMTGRSATPTTGTQTERDRAIRLANDLCDLVQVRSGPEGTTVRIHTRV